ncbi:unnamed protein product, partial [Rotaria magnacalcarata]
KTGVYFKTPLSTLSSHGLNLLNANIKRFTALTSEAERYLVDRITTMKDWSQLSTCHGVLKYAHNGGVRTFEHLHCQEYVELMNLQSHFFDGALKKDCSSLENVLAQGATPDIIDGSYKVLHGILKMRNLLQKPQSLFNMDKPGLYEEAGRRFLVMKRDTKYASQQENRFVLLIQDSCGKGFKTVILKISANDVRLPSYIIHKSLQLYCQWCPKNLIKGTVYNVLDSTKALSAIDAKYLFSKQSATSKIVKRLIKSPYGASVTHLDVFGENIMKQ